MISSMIGKMLGGAMQSIKEMGQEQAFKMMKASISHEQAKAEVERLCSSYGLDRDVFMAQVDAMFNSNSLKEFENNATKLDLPKELESSAIKILGFGG